MPSFGVNMSAVFREQIAAPAERHMQFRVGYLF